MRLDETYVHGAATVAIQKQDLTLFLACDVQAHNALSYIGHCNLAGSFSYQVTLRDGL